MKNEVTTIDRGIMRAGWGRKSPSRRKKHLRTEWGTVKPFGGQAVPEKDTTNRRNRMKLRCVRGGAEKEEWRR